MRCENIYEIRDMRCGVRCEVRCENIYEIRDMRCGVRCEIWDIGCGVCFYEI